MTLKQAMKNLNANLRNQDKVIVYKSSKVYDSKNPYIARKGDVEASFKTKREAKVFAAKEIHKYGYNPVTFALEKD